MIRVYLAPLAVAAAIMLAGAPSAAQTMSRTVRYADLDLNSQPGRDSLSHRISGAIHRLCGEADARDLNQTFDVRQCRSAARRDADARVAKLLDARPQLAGRGDRIVVASR